jgi:CCR4-NOT transcription complex subunit 9
VATFIIQRIILDANGLNFVCNTAERFHAVNTVLSHMISNNPSQRLVKHIIRCYARMAENHRARNILKETFPQTLLDKKFIDTLDEGSKKWLFNFLGSIGINNNSIKKESNPSNNILMNTPFNSTSNSKTNLEYDFFQNGEKN